jgi:hypothetical protein
VKGAARKVIGPPGIVEAGIVLGNKQHRLAGASINDQERLRNLESDQVLEVVVLAERLSSTRALGAGHEEEFVLAQARQDGPASRRVLVGGKGRAGPVRETLRLALRRAGAG